MQRTLSDNIEAAIETMRSLATLESDVATAAELVSGALCGGRKLMTCGNGGSASDAMHMATEFVCRFCRDRRPYPALCLNASGGDLTAIGNDYEYAEVFARPVRAFAQPGDVLLAISSSGKSENIRRALATARDVKCKSVALLGRDGGVCGGLADVELIVAGNDTARIQEAQKLLIHTLCQIVEDALIRE
jgi:D-sedoheptulose 7-phosphate isomerase